jgi:Flp pilus assembly protein TadD/mono/diheme cytochrome c family protein
MSFARWGRFSRGLSFSLFGLLSVSSLAAADAPVTFNRDIAPIVFHSCARCHRPGESGPFSLLSYADVRKHARQVVTVTKTRYMPPWLPEPGIGKFAGERRLTDAQIAMVGRWVDEGMPEGQPQDLPPAPKFKEGWQLGEPDLILTSSQPYRLPAEGSDVYRNFIFTFPLANRRYVRALEIRPGNRRVVHHANLLIDRNRSSRWRDGQDGQPGFPGMELKIEADARDPESHFLFWKPGSVLTEEPDGMAWTVEKGTDLLLNMHLQPSGKPEPVQPSLGLYFTDELPRLHPLLVQLENDGALDIPAGRTDFTVRDEFTLPVDVDLLGVYPHAHYLGKDVEGLATLPDGSKKPLIRIRHWDQNWQAVYRYQDPVFLPQGTVVSMRWIYDNSSGNPANPNRPPARVRSGDRATDEMGHLWLQMLPRGPGDQRTTIEEALMRKRIVRDPADFSAHFNLGGLLQANGDKEGAIEETRQAVRIRPTDEVALNTLGALLQKADRPDEAEASYRAAIKARPNYPDARYNLANLLLSRDAVEEAVPELRQVVQLQPDDAKANSLLAEVLETRAQALAGRGKLDEATADLREALQLKPDDSDACTNLGVALALQGKLVEAKALFERALKLNPQSDGARKNLERVRQALAAKGSK